jgi:hypothetical protein
MAVGHERAHAEGIGQRKGALVMCRGLGDIRGGALGREVTL